MSIGVPIKVLHEAEGHIVTCETNTGEVYRGKLIEAEDNMNCQVRLNHNSFLMRCIYVTQIFTLNLNLLFVQGVLNNETNWAYVLFESDVQHYSNISRWQSVPAGAGIHSRQQNTLPHSARHVEKRPHVEEHEKQKPRCRSGKRQSCYSQSSRLDLFMASFGAFPLSGAARFRTAWFRSVCFRCSLVPL